MWSSLFLPAANIVLFTSQNLLYCKLIITHLCLYSDYYTMYLAIQFFYMFEMHLEITFP